MAAPFTHSKKEPIISAPAATRMNQQQINTLYTILHRIDQAATKSGLRYWMAAGTILGAVRHGGLIPWDDDGDLYVLEPDWRKHSMAFIHAANCLDLHIAPHLLEDGSQSDFWYKVYLGANRFPNVDIFLMDWRSEDGCWKMSDHYAYKWWPKELLTPEEISGTSRIPFGPLYLPAPANPAIYCERTYGADWNTTYYEGWDHANEKPVKSEKKVLTKPVPALPSVDFR